jgi:F-type H+-transporting ATPase subunit gamma
MASLKAIRKRISSVKNTQQITKAMKMVAASKLRRAQEAAVAARPYADKLEIMVEHLVSRIEPDSHPLMATPGTENRTLLVIVAGDRGLCGGYNANLLRRAEQFIATRTGEVRLVLIGRKGSEYFRRRHRDPGGYLPVPAADVAPGVARQVAARIAREFISEEIDNAHVLYSAFRSALSQVPTVEKLLPLDRNVEEGEAHGVDYLFEPGPAEIVGTLLPRLLEVRILHALLEAGASEQGARMAAMDSATRNASEMIERLTLEMNRTRQAAITKELMEIISGAEALKG